MKRFHPAKPVSVYQVDSHAWWSMKASIFVRAVRYGGRWASNEPIKHLADKHGKLVRLVCLGCGRPMTQWEYMEGRCDQCGLDGQEAIRLERLRAKMREAGARARQRLNDLMLDQLKGGNE